MKTWTRPLILSFCAALLAGCLPKKRIVWSPDGSMAAVITDRDLRFIDAEGAVLPMRLSGTVGQCAWFSDGKRIAAVLSRNAETWDDVAQALTDGQQAFIKEYAAQAKQAILAYQGDWKDFEFSQKQPCSTSLEVALMMYLRDKLSEGLPEKLGDEWEGVRKIELSISDLQVFTLEGATPAPGPVLATSIDDITRPNVSPDGNFVAYLNQQWDRADAAPALYVVPTRSGGAKLVAERVALGHDWSTDGRSLALIRATSEQPEDDSNVRLGVLTTATVAKPDGTLLDEPSPVEDRVGLIFSEALSVRWMKDGRLLFSSVELSLPATSREMPQEWSLFTLDPRMPASVNRVLGRDLDRPLNSEVPLFELSPDEARVLLPGSNGHVTIYEFASGTADDLVPVGEGRESKMRSFPSWRNNDEACFVVPGSDKGSPKQAAEVVMWKDGKLQNLSQDWPEDMRAGWLVGG